jgi:hypothetical protein
MWAKRKICLWNVLHRRQSLCAHIRTIPRRYAPGAFVLSVYSGIPRIPHPLQILFFFFARKPFSGTDGFCLAYFQPKAYASEPEGMYLPSRPVVRMLCKFAIPAGTPQDLRLSSLRSLGITNLPKGRFAAPLWIPPAKGFSTPSPRFRGPCP